MSDFAQLGLITTLPRLNAAHLPVIEAELAELARTRPIGLVLPCHATDLEKPALQQIAHELSGAPFLAGIVLSINGGAPRALPAWTRAMTVLWNDPHPSGKGENVAAAFRYLAGNTPCQIFATQDCDVATFRRQDLARLVHAVAHPQLGFRFAKMYYHRATDRLYGRVSRLFLAPLLSAISRVAGPLPLVEFLRSFRYPLAGEVALTRELAKSLPQQCGWTLELGQLCEVFRRIDPREVCEVEGPAIYEHRHQSAQPALASMAAALAAELFAQLATDGFQITAAFHAATLAAYRAESALALRRSASLALMNALPFDAAAEQALVSTFAELLGHLPLPEQRSN